MNENEYTDLPAAEEETAPAAVPAAGEENAAPENAAPETGSRRPRLNSDPAAPEEAAPAEESAATEQTDRRENGKTVRRKKRVYNPLYFIGEAFRNAWRNRVMSLAAVLVLTSCLILLGAFAILVININLNLERLGLLNEIVVFVDYDLEQSRVDDICADIQALDNVAYVEYVSKAQGLSEMKETYADYGELFDGLEASGDNPLADSFRITYKDNAGVYELESALHDIPGVTRVNNRLDYAVKVESFKHGMSLVFAWFLALLFAVSVFVIFNTIKLAVHGRRAEISIMRFIGATRLFIVTPFIIEGLLIGLVSGTAAYFADGALYRYVIRSASAGLQMIEFRPLADFDLIMLFSFLAIGIVTGVVSSLISLSRNLNN